MSCVHVQFMGKAHDWSCYGMNLQYMSFVHAECIGTAHNINYLATLN